MNTQTVSPQKSDDSDREAYRRSLKLFISAEAIRSSLVAIKAELTSFNLLT